jgi:hypothetical protein
MVDNQHYVNLNVDGAGKSAGSPGCSSGSSRRSVLAAAAVLAAKLRRTAQQAQENRAASSGEPRSKLRRTAPEEANVHTPTMSAAAGDDGSGPAAHVHMPRSPAAGVTDPAAISNSPQNERRTGKPHSCVHKTDVSSSTA